MNSGIIPHVDKTSEKRPMNYHHGNLREALLDAATQLLVVEGPEGLSLRAAARQAGVSQSAPYRHFSAKEELLVAVGQRGFQKLKGELTRELESVKGHEERLKTVARSYVRFAQQNPNLFRLMFGPLMGPDNGYESLDLHCQACFEILLTTIAEAQADGALKAGDTMLLGKTAWALVHGIAHLALDGQLDLEQFGGLDPFVNMLSDNLLDGLKNS